MNGEEVKRLLRWGGGWGKTGGGIIMGGGVENDRRAPDMTRPAFSCL